MLYGFQFSIFSLFFFSGVGRHVTKIIRGIPLVCEDGSKGRVSLWMGHESSPGTVHDPLKTNLMSLLLAHPLQVKAQPRLWGLEFSLPDFTLNSKSAINYFISLTPFSYYSTSLIYLHIKLLESKSNFSKPQKNQNPANKDDDFIKSIERKKKLTSTSMYSWLYQSCLDMGPF